MMNGLLNIYHSFTGVIDTNHFVNNLNSIDVVTVMSSYVKKSLQDSGVVVPIYVTGLGIDKIYIPDANESSKNTFSFLHISSCFERKGIDVLLNSYFDTFNANDKVRLVIKTFPNPHNKVEALLASLKDRYSHPPSVVLINEDWGDSSKLLQLYYDCDVLVMPSRGEGFCLPIGEALMCGKPVIATGWQMDMLNHDYPWLIDFTFKRSSSHLSEGDASLVEPSPRSLSGASSNQFLFNKRI